MSDLMMKLAMDNIYVLPHVASVLHEIDDFAVDVLQESTKQNNRIFIVANDLSHSDLHTDTPHQVGTVVTIERIEREKHKRKLFVKGLYRARITPSLNLFKPDYVSVEKLREKEVSLQKMKLACMGLIKKFEDYAKQEDSLRAYQTVEKFNRYDIQQINDPEMMIYIINKLTQMAMYDFSFHPADNQHILEEDDIIVRALEVESIMENMLIESYNHAYSYPEYVYERPTIDDTTMIEEMKTVAMIEDVGVPERNNEKTEEMKTKRETAPNKREKNSELKDIVAKLNKLNIPKENRRMVQRELDKANRLNKSTNEYREVITYLNVVTNLPWSFEREEQSILEAEQVLNESHDGMDIVKKEIIKYLAERKLNGEAKGAVLCLAGPPGVGKTSLVRSIAEAMNKVVCSNKIRWCRARSDD